MAATIVLDQQVRNGAFATGSIPVPAGATNVTMGSTMSEADAVDTTKSCRMKISFSYDNGQTYYSDPAWQTEWQGGLNRFNQPNVPSLGISVQNDPRPGSPTYDQPPTRVMSSIDTEGNSLNMGVTLEAV